MNDTLGASGENQEPLKPNVFVLKLIQFGDHVTDTLGLTHILEETFMEKLMSGNYPQMQPVNPTDTFLQKRSHAKDEWCLDLSVLCADKSGDTSWPDIIKSIYNSPKMEGWTNDDFSFYEFVGEYKKRRLRVIFYNSKDRMTGNKIPLQKLIDAKQPIRICLY